MIQQATRATPRLDLGAAFLEYQTTAAVFAGIQALAVFESQKKAAKFEKITRESLLNLADAKRSTAGDYNRIDLYAEDDDFSCEEFGLEGRLGDEQRSLYKADFDAEVAKTNQAGHILMVRQDVRAAALLFDPTTSWPTTDSNLYTDVSAAPWDAAGSDAIGHVIAASEKVRRNTGVKPNALLVGKVSLNNLLQNTGILARFPGAALVTAAMLRNAMAAIFDLDKLIVGETVYNGAKEGQAFSGTDVWNDDYALICRVAEPNAPLETPCVGRTILWGADSPQNPTVETYRQEDVRSTIIRVRHHVDELILDPYFGHLLKVDA